MERKLGRAHQVHVCKTPTCLRKNREGCVVCKNHAPWPLVEKTVVHASGILDLRKVAAIRNQLPYVSAYVSAKSGKIWPFEKSKKF